MVRAIVALAHTLGMDVVAEGVETPEQVVALQALGCEYAQGFYFSRPVDLPAADDLIASQPWREGAKTACEISDSTSIWILGFRSSFRPRRPRLSSIRARTSALPHHSPRTDRFSRTAPRRLVSRPEQDDRPVDRIRECSAEHELAAGGRRARVLEVRAPKGFRRSS